MNVNLLAYKSLRHAELTLSGVTDMLAKKRTLVVEPRVIVF